MRPGMRHADDDGKRVAALRGATIIVTRPAGTAAVLARLAHAAGASVALLPGLRLRAIADVDIDVAKRAGIWIFTSPAAVRFAFAAGLPASRHAESLAVGEGTRAALARRGLSALAPAGRGDSESLLALPALDQVRGRHVALFGAAGGRDVIAPGLRARGAVVEAVHVYERLPPRLTRRHLDVVEQAPNPLIALVSSGDALTNLVARLPEALLQRLRAQALVVSSARLAAIARAAGFAEVLIAQSALPRDLLAAAARCLARHRL